MKAPITQAEEVGCLGYDINAHPDGKPWTKCCTGLDTSGRLNTCQCLMRKPPGGDSRYDASLDTSGSSLFLGLDQLKAEKGRFFCTHRKDGEYHRECAGWAAKFSGNK